MAKTDKEQPAPKSVADWRGEREQLRIEESTLLAQLFRTTDANEAARLHGAVLCLPRKAYLLTGGLETAQVIEDAAEAERIDGQVTELERRADAAEKAMAGFKDAIEKQVEAERVRILKNKARELAGMRDMLRERSGDISKYDPEDETRWPIAALNSAAGQRRMCRERVMSILRDGHSIFSAPNPMAAANQ